MNRPSALARFAAAAGLVVLASGCASTNAEDTDASTSTTSSTSESGSQTGSETESGETSAQDTTSAGAGSDAVTGTYSASGSYTSPGGQQNIEVELTLQDGTISAITVTPQASDPQALRYQTDFADNVADQVIGKSLEDANVDTVASSSLTGTGFNAALEQIREQAGE